MQNAETVLSILRERGRRGLSCDELYRQMFNPQLYLLAYGRIYPNQGALTSGVTAGQGGRESRLQGEGTQVSTDRQER